MEHKENSILKPVRTTRWTKDARDNWIGPDWEEWSMLGSSLRSTFCGRGWFETVMWRQILHKRHEYIVVDAMRVYMTAWEWMQVPGPSAHRRAAESTPVASKRVFVESGCSNDIRAFRNNVLK
jgi:hypothetical protein